MAYLIKRKDGVPYKRAYQTAVKNTGFVDEHANLCYKLFFYDKGRSSVLLGQFKQEIFLIVLFVCLFSLSALAKGNDQQAMLMDPLAESLVEQQMDFLARLEISIENSQENATLKRKGGFPAHFLCFQISKSQSALESLLLLDNQQYRFIYRPEVYRELAKIKDAFDDGDSCTSVSQFDRDKYMRVLSNVQQLLAQFHQRFIKQN